MPCGTCNIASGVPSLNCTGPGPADKMITDAPEGCILHHVSRRFRTCRRKQGSRGSEVAKSRTRRLRTAILRSAIRAILGY
eukprot:5163334-Alexandrium_andersonii.AAC.1